VRENIKKKGTGHTVEKGGGKEGKSLFFLGGKGRPLRSSMGKGGLRHQRESTRILHLSKGKRKKNLSPRSKLKKGKSDEGNHRKKREKREREGKESLTIRKDGDQFRATLRKRRELFREEKERKKSAGVLILLAGENPGARMVERKGERGISYGKKGEGK